MAHIKIRSSKSANASIDYGNSRAVERSGVDCDPEHAKIQFEITRKLHDKNDGRQAYTVIHSFTPGEVTPEKANELGRELAKKIAPGHETAIFTHADKDHIHNHIVINSVNAETGRKYHVTKEDYHNARHQSNLISAKNGLTIPYLPDDQRIYGENARYSKKAPVRHTKTEQELVVEQGKNSWKEEIRQAIDAERQKANSYEEFKANLKKNHGITTVDDRKHTVYIHPDRANERDKGKVRGYRLGDDYTREGVSNVITQQNTKRIEQRTEPSSEAVAAADGYIKAVVDEVRAAAAERQQAIQRAADAHRQAVESEQRRIAEADRRTREPKRDIPKPTRNSSWERVR